MLLLVALSVDALQRKLSVSVVAALLACLLLFILATYLALHDDHCHIIIHAAQPTARGLFHRALFSRSLILAIRLTRLKRSICSLLPFAAIAVFAADCRLLS